MASVLVNRLRRPLQRNHQTPRRCPSVRIIHSNFVPNRFSILTCEPFRDVQLLARDTLKCEWPVVRGVDYQAVAFPVSDRMPQPLLNGLRWMRPVVKVD